MGINRTMWICELGIRASCIVQILFSEFFQYRPECWDSESEGLLIRAGLIDKNGDITEDGRKRAFGLFTQIADVFDIRPVDPEEFYRRWSSPTL